MIIQNWYNRIFFNDYFWRTYDQQEIDLVEEREGNLFGYEFKWKPKPSLKALIAWTKAYPNGHFQVITNENFLEFYWSKDYLFC